MGLFNSFSKKAPKPYRQDAANITYDLLFCDDIELYRSETNATGFPWNILFAKKPEVDKLKVVAGDSTIDSRHKILANNILLSLGVAINKKELLGVITEIGLHDGIDVLAVYRDGTARYIDHSCKVTVWEAKTAPSEKLIDRIFADGMNVVNQMEPLHEPRWPFPANGKIRLTFLVSDGLYFWDGPFEAMHKDDLAGPVIDSCTNLLTYLTGKK